MTEVERLAETFAEEVLARTPVGATFLGDRRYDDRLNDIGPMARQAERDALTRLQDALGHIESSPETDAEGRITRHMLALAATHGIATLDHRLYQLAVDQLSGPQVALALLLNWHTLETEKNARDLLARLRGIPAFVDQYIANLTEGVAEGRTSWRTACDRVVTQIRVFLATEPELSAYGRAVAKSPALRDELLAAVRDGVYPAFAKLLGFLEGSYAPVARTEPGLWSIPGGEALYAELVRHVTQSERTPEEIHAIGLQDLGRIHDELRSLGVADIRQHAAALKADAAHFFDSRQGIVDAAQAMVERAQAALPRLFGRRPTTPCRVLPIEEYREKDSVVGFYFPPTEDGSRPGTYYVNTFEPHTRPRYNLVALTLHEAVPGHHLQIALGNEARGLPRFRRHRLGTQAALTAFTEGWGLYSERLGVEMQMYDSDIERFGMLSYQAMRAARLVVDTGLHALRWPRERAVEFMRENAGIPDGEAANEIDRYVVWPAQALAYKMGQRHIEDLRRRAAEALGSGFDVRAFHDELLSHGALPLSTATLAIEHWIAAQRKFAGQLTAGGGNPGRASK